MRIINQPYSTFSKILLLLFAIFLQGFLFTPNFFLAAFSLIPIWILVYQTGVEIDFDNKRLRNISGPLASKAEEWKDISEASYLGMIDVREGRELQPSSRPGVASVNLGKVAVNMFFEDRQYIQIFRGTSKKADRIVDILFKELGVAVYDPNAEDDD